MRPSPSWWGGLRGRLTAALVAVSGLTLAVATFALLLPLGRVLRDDAVTSLSQTVAAARPSFDEMTRDQVHQRSPELWQAARVLRRRADAEVTVIDREGTVLVATDPDLREPRLTDVAQQLDRHSEVKGVTRDGQAQAAIRFYAGGRRIGLVLRRSLRGVTDAVDTVRQTLIFSGLLGLTVAVLAGLALAGRLSRRLRSLRDMTMELAERGPVLDVPPDPSRDEIGDLSRAFATMQERLREQEQARRTFVATASHELRTPLASLRLILESVAEDLEHPDADLEDAREQVDRGRAQSERLARLAAELLDLSRIDAAVPLRSEPLELGELARAVIAEFEARASHNEASIDLQAQSPCWAIADPGGVARIVRILVDNALRHGGGDEVTVTVAHEGTRASVSVQDRGPGIPESERDLVFERFHRGAAANRVPGFGLGLAIGRELARTMGGDLAIADCPPPGALFVLSLPAAAESDLPLRPPGEPVAAGEL